MYSTVRVAKKVKTYGLRQALVWEFKGTMSFSGKCNFTFLLAYFLYTAVALAVPRLVFQRATLIARFKSFLQSILS